MSALSKFIAIATLTAGLGGLLGCAVAIPVHQDDSAQTLGLHKVDIAGLAAIGPTLGPRNFPSGSNFTPTATVEPQTFNGMRIAYGIRENYDVELEFGLSIFGGGVTSLGIKHQWYGPSYFKGKAGDNYSGMRFRYTAASGFEDTTSNWNKGDHLLNGNIYVDSLSADMLSFDNSWGHLLTNWLGVYGGVEAGTAMLKSKLRDGGPTGTPYSDNRTVYYGGPVAGLSLHTTGESVRVALTFELEYLSVPYTYENGNSFALFDSAGFHVTF